MSQLANQKNEKNDRLRFLKYSIVWGIVQIYSFVLDDHTTTCYVLCILILGKPLIASKYCILYKFGRTKLLAFDGQYVF